MGNKNLISKVISGNASTSEMQKFQTWLSESDDNKLEYQELLNLWQVSSNLYKFENDCNVDNAWSKFLDNKENISLNKPSRILYKIAAILIIVLTVGSFTSYFVFKNNRVDSILFANNFSKAKNSLKNINNNTKDDNVLIAKTGSNIKRNAKSKIITNIKKNDYSEYIMEDSSSIKLSDNSALKFLDQDKQNSRIASLMGAGIFDIKPSNQLFILETEHVIIHVEGTKFRVNEPTDDYPYVELYVNEGNMEVFEKNNISNNVSLNSGQKYLFDINSKQFIQVIDKTVKQSKWKLFWKKNKNQH